MRINQERLGNHTGGTPTGKKSPAKVGPGSVGLWFYRMVIAKASVAIWSFRIVIPVHISLELEEGLFLPFPPTDSEKISSHSMVDQGTRVGNLSQNLLMGIQYELLLQETLVLAG